MRKRKWPTVPEILRCAVEVHDRHIGEGPAVYFVDRESRAIVPVHAATVPNLLKAIRSDWPSDDTWDRTVYRSPSR